MPWLILEFADCMDLQLWERGVPVKSMQYAQTAVKTYHGPPTRQGDRNVAGDVRCEHS
jgi:hypothetical protein